MIHEKDSNHLFSSKNQQSFGSFLKIRVPTSISIEIERLKTFESNVRTANSPLRPSVNTIDPIAQSFSNSPPASPNKAYAN